MRVMIDTNIFISAALFPNGKAAQALMKAFLPPFQPMTCDYVIDELRRKFSEKFPDRITELDAFLYHSSFVIDVVETYDNETTDEPMIRDVKDQPILRTAIYHQVDYILTGDKDFLSLSLQHPTVISVADFLNLRLK